MLNQNQKASRETATFHLNEIRKILGVMIDEPKPLNSENGRAIAQTLIHQANRIQKQPQGTPSC